MYTAILSDYARKVLSHPGVEKGKCKVKHNSQWEVTTAFVEFPWLLLYTVTLTLFSPFSCAIVFLNKAFLKHVTAADSTVEWCVFQYICMTCIYTVPSSYKSFYFVNKASHTHEHTVLYQEEQRSKHFCYKVIFVHSFIIILYPTCQC